MYVPVTRDIMNVPAMLVAVLVAVAVMTVTAAPVNNARLGAHLHPLRAHPLSAHPLSASPHHSSHSHARSTSRRLPTRAFLEMFTDRPSCAWTASRHEWPSAGERHASTSTRELADFLLTADEDLAHFHGTTAGDEDSDPCTGVPLTMLFQRCRHKRNAGARLRALQRTALLAAAARGDHAIVNGVLNACPQLRHEEPLTLRMAAGSARAALGQLVMTIRPQLEQRRFELVREMAVWRLAEQTSGEVHARIGELKRVREELAETARLVQEFEEVLNVTACDGDVCDLSAADLTVATVADLRVTDGNVDDASMPE